MYSNDTVNGGNNQSETAVLDRNNDMPNGYYIYNMSTDKVSFYISEETEYNFLDWGQDFVTEGEDRNYSTTDIEEFLEYLDTYLDKGERVPFWIEIKDDSVISIIE